jgi:hypothetical protein
VYSIKAGTEPLDRVSSFGAMTAGTFYYNSTNSELFVWTSGSSNPQTDEEMIVTYRFFFGSASVSTTWDLEDLSTDVHYEGRITLSPGYKHKVAVEQNLVSIIGNGSLKLLNNDGALDEIYDTIIFDNHTIEIYSWHRDLSPSEALIIYRGKVVNKRFQFDNVAFEVKDLLFDLNQNIPQDVYTDDDTVAENVKGDFKRWVYGRVDGLRLQSIDQIGEGYNLTGTVSINNLSQAAIGVGTLFLSECSPGDQITIGTQEFNIESIQSNTELTLDNIPDYAAQGSTIRIVPEVPVTSKNREFFVAGHATARLTKTLTEVIQFNRVKLNNTTDLEAGDFLEFSTSERVEIKNVAPNNIVVLRQNLIAIPPVSSSVTREPVQAVFLNGKSVESSKYTITNQGPTNKKTTIELDSDVEFYMTRAKQLGLTFTFTNGSRVATTTSDLDLTEILKPRDWIRPSDLSYTTYYEIMSVGEGRVLTGTVSGNPNTTTLTGSSTLFTSQISPGDDIIVGGVSYNVASITNNLSLVLSSPPEIEFSGLGLRKQDEKAIELRVAFADPTHTGPTQGKLPEYIGDNTTVSANVLGKTESGTPTGAWIKTAAQVIRDLIREAGITDVNETSFTAGALENAQLISVAVPLSPGSQSTTYKTLLDLLTRSVTACLTLDNDLKLKYKAINVSIPDSPVTIDDFDVIDWNLETNNGKNTRHTIVRYRHTDVDRTTLEAGSKAKTHSSDFVEKYIGTNNTDEITAYLYKERDAEILTHRNTYLQSLGRSDMSITTDLRLEELEIGDTVILDFKRLYKRFGDPNTRQKAMMVVGKTLNGERTKLELSDLGNIFNRSSVITPNTAPNFTSASIIEKIKYGYITEANGIVNNDETTANTHLIS